MAYRLLLADDSITIQKVVELTLTEEGFDVTAVGDGETALETARKLMPDVVLADVFMPRMDGYVLCERLKDDPSLKSVPVILLAGTFEVFDEERAARIGAADHLTKPFESADLIAKVKKQVEKAHAAPPETPEPVLEAEPEMAELEEAVPAGDSDDLWSVVDMADEKQPLATAAQQGMKEEEIWKRAHLISDSGETAAFPKEEDLPWEAISAEPAEEAEEPAMAAVEVSVEEAMPFEMEDDEPPSEKTAILNLDDIQASAFTMPEGAPGIDLVEPEEELEITPFEGLHEASSAQGFAAARPAVQEAPAASAGAAVPAQVSMEAVKDEVRRIAEAMLDTKVKEALSNMSREMVEQIIWEVVPDLAEEMIQKEIGRLKAGIQ